MNRPCVGGSHRHGASRSRSVRCRQPRGPRRVHDELRRDSDRTALSRPLERRPATLASDAADLRRVQEDRAGGGGVMCQRLVEIRPIPVRVCDLVVGTCRDEQLALVPLVVFERLVETMEEEREAAFQPGPDARVGPLPRSPFRERPDSRQIVPVRQIPRGADWRVAWTIRRLRTGDAAPVPPARPGDSAAAARVRPASRQIPSRRPRRRRRWSRPARLS